MATLQKVYRGPKPATEVVATRITPELFIWVRDKAESSDRTISNQIRVFLQKLKDADKNHKERK